MFIVSLIFFLLGFSFWYIGAWPVFGFLGLDVLLLYYAFKINYKSGEIFETVKIIQQTYSLREIFHLEKNKLGILSLTGLKLKYLIPQDTNII